MSEEGNTIWTECFEPWPDTAIIVSAPTAAKPIPGGGSVQVSKFSCCSLRIRFGVCSWIYN